ncbi:MAG: SufS family cysteine desulfurase [Gemmataceae bacterium]
MTPTTLSAPTGNRLSAPPASPLDPVDLRRLREEFPALRQKVHGKPLIYLDNAATAQKPRAVLEAMERFYTQDNANIHRAVHQLSERATRAYEAVRGKVARFLNAAEESEIVFVRGATEGINLVANSWGRANLRPGDEILISHLEHHANIVPWQLIAQQTGAVLKVLPINERGEWQLDQLQEWLTPRTKMVAVVHLSNSLGTLNPIEAVIARARAVGACVLIDAAQSVTHLPLDLQALDCDFLVFSAHKLYGPTGVGVLYGKRTLLEQMPPWQGGGDMIRQVTFQGTTYADVPARFEAGTPNIAGVIGLGAAIDFVRGVGLEAIAAHEEELTQRAVSLLRAIPGVRLIGEPAERVGVVSFVVEGLSALDVGTRLDLEGIAVRTGHHCCQPVMEYFGVPGTVRASFALYNTLAEVETFASVLRGIAEEARRRALPLEDSQRCPAQVELCHAEASTCPPRTQEIAYAPRMADSPQAAAQEILELFEMFEDWNDRYQHLIDLGDKLPLMPEEFKTECTRVPGCQSIVYLTAREKPDQPGVVEFLADSDAGLVRGLIALLEQLFSGQRAEDILAFDVDDFFKKLGLDQHLSLNRRNGLASMVQRIRQHAQALARGR